MMPSNTPVSVEEFQALFDRLNHWGRYEVPDRGAWNNVGPEQAKRGSAAIRSGRVVGMALPWNTVAEVDNPKPALHFMSDLGDVEPGQPTCNKDFIGIDYHGKSCSHLDALAHIAWQGQLFDGNRSAEVVGAGGATFGTVGALGPIVTRGVLLDLPAVRGVDWLEPGEALHAEDLQAAEDFAGVRIEPGDAVLLRCGQFARRRALGPWDSGEASAGIHAGAMPWIHERDIAVLGADGDSDVRPSPVPGVHSPIHILSLTAMGVPLLDNLDLEALSQACREEGSYAFQLTLAPLNIPMGTGCPLNPVAVL